MLFLVLVVQGGYSEELTIEKAWHFVCKCSPHLQIVEEKLCEAKGGTMQASLTPNPELSLSLGRSDSRSVSGHTQMDFDYEISQEIELGGKKAARVGHARWEEEVALWEIKETRRELFLELIHSIIEVKASEERVVIAREQMKISAEALKTIEAKVNAGKSTRLHLTQGQLLHDQKKADCYLAKNSLEIAKHHLASLWGGEGDSIDSVQFNLKNLMDHSSYAVYEQALKHHPTLCRLESEKCSARWDQAVQNSEAIPDVKLSIGMDNEENFQDCDIGFGLSIPLPIFDRNQGNRYQALKKVCRKKSEKRYEWLKLLRELNATFFEMKSAYKRACILRDHVDQRLNLILKDVEEGYKQGKLEYYEVLVTQEDFFKIQSEYIDALSHFHQKMAELQVLVAPPSDCISFFQLYKEKP